MPNWTENVVTIRGPRESLDDFQSKAAGINPAWINHYGESAPEEDRRTPFAFCKFIPVPDEVLFQPYSVAGYEWCNINWHTKWDVVEVTVTRTPEYLAYRFDTAWNAPHQVIVAASRLYPELTFTHAWSDEDDGYETRYVNVYRDGELVSKTVAR